MIPMMGVDRSNGMLSSLRQDARRTVLGVGVVAALVLASIARADCEGGWSVRTPMGIPRQEIGVAAIGEVLFALGGFDDAARTVAAAEAYDTRGDHWTVIPPLPLALNHVGAAAVDGKIYALGGLTADGASVDATFQYDAGTWTARARMPTPRGAMGVAVIDGRIYAAGGFRDGASVADFAVYDPTVDRWTLLPDLPTARDHLAAAAIGGRFYAVGGRAGRLFDVLEVFDPTTATWQTDLAPMPTARGGLAAAALGSRLYTFGGEGNSDHPLGMFHETEVYDPASNGWSALDPMPTPRHGTVAVTIGAAIYVVGGSPRQGLGVSDVSEVFSPPDAEPLMITRARVHGRRLRLRGRVSTALADVAAVPVAVGIADSLGVEIASVALPAGTLTPRGHRLVFRSPRGARGIVRLALRQRPGARLGVRVSLVTENALPANFTVTLVLGETRHCGTAASATPANFHHPRP